MPALLPVLLLVASSLTLIVLKWARRGMGTIWLVGAGLSLVNWVLLLVLRGLGPFTADISSLRLLNGFGGAMIYRLDALSWPYAFGLATLALSMILTAAARFQFQSNPWSWAGNLGLIGMGLLATLAGSLRAFVLAWTAIDLVELAIMLAIAENRSLSVRAVIAFAARALGTLAALWVVFITPASAESEMAFAATDSSAGLLLLLAVGLRLGVLPLHLAFPSEPRMRRGLGSVVRLVANASSLALLAHLPPTVVSGEVANILLPLVLLAAFYGASVWALSRDELTGRSLSLLAVAAMAVACVLRGEPAASVAWGSIYLLCGALLFFYSARSRRLLAIPAVGLLTLSGLPFTPVSPGWPGVSLGQVDLYGMAFALVWGLLLVGYVRHSLRPGEDLAGLDRWMQSVYPAGLAILPISAWILFILNGNFLALPPGWWFGVVAFVLAAGIQALRMLRRQPALEDGQPKPMSLVVRERVLTGLETFFRFEWLYGLFWLAYRLVQKGIRNLTVILEGEGGVLWALLLLALLISLFWPGGSR